MTRDEILTHARAAGMVRTHPGMAVEVVAFARTIEAQVREECARINDEKSRRLAQEAEAAIEQGDIRRKIERGVWLEGKHWRRADGGIYIDTRAVEKWVEVAEG